MQQSGSSGDIIESGLKIDGFVKCKCIRLSIRSQYFFEYLVCEDR